jgi:hypothetical protein
MRQVMIPWAKGQVKQAQDGGANPREGGLTGGERGCYANGKKVSII